MPGQSEKTNRTKMVRFIFWQDILCNSRTNEIHDLLQFSKDIKVFLNTCVDTKVT